MEIKAESSETPNIPAAKRPYEKPAFRYEQVFVTTALHCGKVGATQADCIAHPSAS